MSGPRNVIVFGAGKRVLETALPALLRAEGAFRVTAVFARSAREIACAGRTFAVRRGAELAAADVAPGTLAYVAVGKQATPGVLAQLLAFDLRSVDLLIDTPVLLVKQLRHRGRLAAFRAAWVAEDCAELPWYDAVRALEANGALGPVRSATFHRSAYRYHAFAMLRALFPGRSLARARRTRSGAIETRAVEFAGGASGTVIEPRDYASGHFVLTGANGALTDAAAPEAGALRLEIAVERGRPAGFRAGDVATRFDDGEAGLAAAGTAAGSVTARMEDWKRIGFLRLLRSIAAGRGGYSIAAGIEDMYADFALERFGRYRSGGLLAPNAKIGRAFWATLSRLRGG